MRTSLMAWPKIKSASGRAFKVLSNRGVTSPSKQRALARATLEQAGFKIGPGVDLKVKA
jgi:hypothetical protein